MAFKMFIEIEVEVHYGYQPYEPMTQNYPGADADVTVNTVEIRGKSPMGYDISSILNKDQIELIKSECFEDIKARGEQ